MFEVVFPFGFSNFLRVREKKGREGIIIIIKTEKERFYKKKKKSRK